MENFSNVFVFSLWVGKDSNLRRHKPSDLQSDAFNHFATYPYLQTFNLFKKLNIIKLFKVIL